MFLGNYSPELRDLYRYIATQQAAQWEWLGLELGLNDVQINTISMNHRGDVEACCRSMLSKWLQIDPSASWGKLDDAIRRMTLPSTTSPVSPYKEGNRGDVSKVLYNLKILVQYPLIKKVTVVMLAKYCIT